MKKLFLLACFIIILPPKPCQGAEEPVVLINKRLLKAAEQSNLEGLKQALEDGAFINSVDYNSRTALHWCAFTGNEPCLRILLIKNSDPNRKDKNGKTPLHWAARKNKINCLATLLEFKANINERNKEGGTALHESVVEESNESIKFLIEKNINRSAQMISGETALDLAKKNKKKSSEKVLKEWPRKILLAKKKFKRFKISCFTSFRKK